MGSIDAVQGAIDYFLGNKGNRSKDLDKVVVRANLGILESNENGIPADRLEELAKNVVFANSYDLIIRRKLLYCLVPKNSEFPYKIIPLAISSSMAIPFNNTWQYSVLSWLHSLLEYCVIDPHNRFMHICYTSLFNLTSSLNLVSLVCKILGHMTQREDVTSLRCGVLMKLGSKPGFRDKIAHLLRLYQMFRPDLVVGCGNLIIRRSYTNPPRVLKKSLIALKTRILDNEGDNLRNSDGSLWPNMNQMEKPNPYNRATAIPKPSMFYYAETMEQKTEKMIFVSQYKRFSDLVKGIPDWQKWKWPNNSASLLSCPEILPLFRPHDVSALIGLSDWLQLALKTELINGVGNPSKERQEKLLRACFKLTKVTGRHCPVFNDFLSEYMFVWDQESNFDLMMQMIGQTSYTTPEFASMTLIALLGQLLGDAPIVKWCKVIDAVADTLGTWAVKAYEETSMTEGDITDGYLEWYSYEDRFLDSSLVGLWFLMTQMEKFFMTALIEFEWHSMVVNQILDFYSKVRIYCKELDLAAVFLPNVPISLGVVVRSDLVAIHRLGRMLAETPKEVERVTAKDSQGPHKDVADECLAMCNSFNLAVCFFILGVYKEKAFNKSFQNALDGFYPFNQLERLFQCDSVNKIASVRHALPFLPFFAKTIIDEGDEEMDTSQERDLKNKVIEDLNIEGFFGIGQCIETFVSN